MIKRFLFILMMMFLLPVVLMAQDGGTVIDIEAMSATYAGFLAGVIALTQLYKKMISDKKTFLVSIIISTLGCAAFFLLKIGIFATISWWGALLYDLGIILIIKGFVNIELVMTLLSIAGIGPKTKKLNQ
jgi:hypothetical protein